LGRFERLNSWDVFLAPLEFIQYILSLLTDLYNLPTIIGVTLAYSLFFFAAYITFYAFTGLGKSTLVSPVDKKE
jgi:uncharacterized membrane protein